MGHLSCRAIFPDIMVDRGKPRRQGLESLRVASPLWFLRQLALKPNRRSLSYPRHKRSLWAGLRSSCSRRRCLITTVRQSPPGPHIPWRARTYHLQTGSIIRRDRMGLTRFLTSLRLLDHQRLSTSSLHSNSQLCNRGRKRPSRPSCRQKFEQEHLGIPRLLRVLYQLSSARANICTQCFSQGPRLSSSHRHLWIHRGHTFLAQFKAGPRRQQPLSSGTIATPLREPHEARALRELHVRRDPRDLHVQGPTALGRRDLHLVEEVITDMNILDHRFSWSSQIATHGRGRGHGRTRARAHGAHGHHVRDRPHMVDSPLSSTLLPLE
jgi:hypothetical protein